MQVSKKRRDFWVGFSAGCLLAVGLNLLPYLRTHGAYQTDGLELIGFPFVFRRFGGLAPWLYFHWWALAIDILLAGIFAGALGMVWSNCRQYFRRKRLAKATDFGRKFGWFIEKDREVVGELEYVRWDESMQFWHEYRVAWRSPDWAALWARGGPDAWLSEKLVLRNRRFTDVVIDHCLPARTSSDELISIRGAHVEPERIVKDDKL